MKLPELILTDIDGVWTDGGMYYNEKTGDEWKKFNTYDSAGVLFCRLMKIPCGLITGESAKAVLRRGKKLKMDYIHIGVKNKVQVVQEIIDVLQIEWSQVAYLGDDINDLGLFSKVGLSACPYSAPSYIKDRVDWTLDSKGGEGVFREFVERILTINKVDIVQLLKNERIIDFDQ